MLKGFPFDTSRIAGIILRLYSVVRNGYRAHWLHSRLCSRFEQGKVMLLFELTIGRWWFGEPLQAVPEFSLLPYSKPLDRVVSL